MTNTWIYRVFVYLIALSLTGCVVPIYVDAEEPYQEVATNLHVGQTTEEDVLAHYGEPDATYMHGLKYVYSAYEKNWEIPYILPQPGAMGVAISGDRYFLIMDFDDQGILTAQKVELGKGRADCTDSGLCFGKAEAGHIIWKADKAAMKKAKEFPVSAKQCGLYLYLESYSLSDRITASLDDQNLGQVNLVGSGFYYILVDPGRHAITARQTGHRPDSASLQVTCKENEHIFVRMKIHGAKSGTVLMEVVEDSKGKKKVKSRILVIPQSSR